MNEEWTQRLVEVETRLVFQEQSLGELSDAVAALRAAQDRQDRILERVLAELRQLRTLLYADPAGEPPPPHY